MSTTFGLVKFKKTGNIYFGCYNKTSNIMIPFLCTPEECYNKQTISYLPITYCRDLDRQHNYIWKFPDNIIDLDDIEIYASWGLGFGWYWGGTGSESAKMIKDYLNPWKELGSRKIIFETPEWVIKFLKTHNI